MGILCYAFSYIKKWCWDISSPNIPRKGNTMKKMITVISTLFMTLMLLTVGLAGPANAATPTMVDFDDTDWPGVPYRVGGKEPVANSTPLSQDDLWVAAEQYMARDGFSATHALGAGNYTVLNLDVPSEGVPADLSNGTCPGPIRYTNVGVPPEGFVAELGECGGWDRYGWLQEGYVVRMSGNVTGNYMVHDVLALGAPGNQKLGFTDTPDVVLTVNNPNAPNELYMFGLIDYTKRSANLTP